MLKKFFLTFIFFFFIITTEKTNAEVIKNITINGNDNTPERLILSKLPFKKGQNITNRDINNAVKILYRSGNFSDISINSNGSGNLTIDVLESPIVAGIYLTGNSQLSIDDIKKELSSKEIQIYSKSKVKFDVDRLYGFYQKMGYLNVKIEPKVVFLQNNAVDLIFDIQEGDLSYISSINFYGNNNISSSKLKENIVSQERSMTTLSSSSGRFEEDNIEKDKQMIKMYYQNQGYATADIINYSSSFDKENYNFTLNYFIKEGEKYNFNDTNILCQLNVIKNDPKIREKIKIKKGQQFSLSAIQETLFEITKYLNENGYANIHPTHTLDINEDTKEVNVDFILNVKQKIYIDKITISGNNTTKENVIRRELVIHEGDLYNTQLIVESRDRLYMLGYFKVVDIKEHFVPNSDLVNLEIVVEEQFFGNVQFSLGYNNYYGIIGTINLQINNLLGRGFSSGIMFERSGYSETYSFNFYDPYFIERYKIGFGLNAYYSRFGDLGGGTRYLSYLLYKGQSYGVNATFGFEIVNRLNLQFTLGFLQYQQQILNAIGYKLYEQLIGTRTSYSFGYNLTWNMANRARYATKGFLIQVGQTFSGFNAIGNQNFVKSTFNFNWNLQLWGEDLILHTEVAAGNATNFGKNNQIIGIEHLFSLGGGMQMKGFNYFGIGPRIRRTAPNGQYSDLYYAIQALNYYYISIELRSPLFIPKDYGIFFSVFMDAGSAFGFNGKEKNYTDGAVYTEEVLDTAKIRMSVGGAITWRSNFGEIGFYYAKPIIKQAYDTTLEFGVKFGTQM